MNIKSWFSKTPEDYNKSLEVKAEETEKRAALLEARAKTSKRLADAEERCVKAKGEIRGQRSSFTKKVLIGVVILVVLLFASRSCGGC